MKFLKNVKTDEFMATVTRTASKYRNRREEYARRPDESDSSYWS